MFFIYIKVFSDNLIIIKNFLQNAFKIIVCVNKDKDLLEKYYNAQEDKIVIQPFVSRLPLIYNEKKDTENYNNYYDVGFFYFYNSVLGFPL